MKEDFQENYESTAFVASPLSDYETERDKPMPTTIHGSIEANLIFELRMLYGQKFRLACEVTLATKPNASTPDVLILPPSQLDFSNDPAKRTEPVLVAIEIISASQGIDLFFDKAKMYFDFGVKSFWVVFPRMRAVAVFNQPDDSESYLFFNGKAEIVDDSVGVRLPVEKVFACIHFFGFPKNGGERKS